MEHKYRFDLYSFGHLNDSVETTNLTKAKTLYMEYQSLEDMGVKVYIDNNLIPYKEIKKSLEIDEKFIFTFYKTHSKI